METQGYNQDGAGYTTAPVAHEKKGVAEKVKGMLGGHGSHKTHPAADHQQFGVYGDATPQTGTAESTRVGCLDKIKAKAGVGHGLAPEQTRAAHHNQAYVDPSSSPDFNGGTNVNSSAAVHGGWPYPTKPNQSSYGEQPHSTQPGGNGVEQPHMAGGGYEPHSTQPGGYGVHDPNGVHNPNQVGGQSTQPGGYGVHNPNQAGGYEPQSTQPGGYGVQNPNGVHNPNQVGGYEPQSTQPGGYGVHNPNQAGGYEPQSTQPGGYGVHDPNHAGGYRNSNLAGDPQPTNPTGVTNAAGGAVLDDRRGNIHEGPRDDGVKKEGVVSKLVDKLHKKPANTTAGGYEPHSTQPAGYGVHDPNQAGGYEPHSTQPGVHGVHDPNQAGGYEPHSTQPGGYGVHDPNQAGGYEPQSTQPAGYGVHNPNQAGGYEPQSTQPAGYGVHDPNQAGGYRNSNLASDPQPTNPTGVSNAAGGAVLDDHRGNIHEGPRDDGVKKEGVVSKLMDKLHKKPANTSPTTY